MNSALEIDGKTLHPIKDAAQTTRYSRDYITRLAREGKIAASYIGRQWFVDTDSLRVYAENVALEQEVRKRILSEERKNERKIREAVDRQHKRRVQKSTSLNARAVVVASLVLGFGLLTGQAAYYLNSNQQLLLGGSIATEQSAQLGSVSAVEWSETVSQVESQAKTETQATFEQRSLGEIERGIMLFPAAGSVERPEALFSDSVEIRRLADGTQVVVPVDASGKQIGNVIPFVNVPVQYSNR